MHDSLNGNTIYFTEERWQHILESRPELEPFFDQFLDTLCKGRRHQDPLIPNKCGWVGRLASWSVG